MPIPPPGGLITLLTDFGHRDPYVGIMKGAVLRAGPSTQLIDICHEVPPQDLEVAAFFTGALVGRFPDGSVHLSVIDPGVGTERRMLAVCAARCFWIAPDNGLLSELLRRSDSEVRSIDFMALGLRPESRTFHGRDLFAPVAGFLAGGRYGFRALGPRVDDPVMCEVDERSRVLFVDSFGNLITNVRPEPGVAGALRIGVFDVPIVGTYAEGEPGCPMALLNSYGTLEVAIPDGSAYQQLGLGRGEPVALIEGQGQS